MAKSFYNNMRCICQVLLCLHADARIWHHLIGSDNDCTCDKARMILMNDSLKSISLYDEQSKSAVSMWYLV